MLVVTAGYIYAKRNTSKTVNFVHEQSRLINSGKEGKAGRERINFVQSEKFKQYGSLHPIDMSEIVIQQRIGRGSCAEVYMGVWYKIFPSFAFVVIAYLFSCFL